jgi:soluble lytic murein transglycosylase-like protein
MFATVSQNLALPPGLLLALCQTESGLNPQAFHKDDGPEDSIGLCQLHLSTAKDVGYKGDKAGLYDPHTNMWYAGLYLKAKLKKYKKVSFAVASYNAGSVRFTEDGSIRNFRYVNKVLTNWSFKRRKLHEVNTTKN